MRTLNNDFDLRGTTELVEFAGRVGEGSILKAETIIQYLAKKEVSFDTPLHDEAEDYIHTVGFGVSSCRFRTKCYHCINNAMSLGAIDRVWHGHYMVLPKNAIAATSEMEESI